jgi:uncharacterized protein
MREIPSEASVRHKPAWGGLLLSLFGMLGIRWLILHFSADPRGPHAVFIRELLYFALALVLLLLVRFKEKRPLSSIGIGTSVWWKSLVWGILTCLVCGGVALALAKLTHYTGGEAGKAFGRLPTWLITLVVVRAGIVEEICYRGYSMEHLKEAGFPPALTFLIPLVIFGFGHWTGGWQNILIALVLGAVLAGLYLWRRDLIANMIGHFLVDFVGNVLPRLGG